MSIDFGYSFGHGLRLQIPELSPFRLTPCFEGFLYPHSSPEGVYLDVLARCLETLRENQRDVANWLSPKIACRVNSISTPEAYSVNSFLKDSKLSSLQSDSLDFFDFQVQRIIVLDKEKFHFILEKRLCISESLYCCSASLRCSSTYLRCSSASNSY